MDTVIVLIFLRRHSNHLLKNPRKIILVGISELLRHLVNIGVRNPEKPAGFFHFQIDKKIHRGMLRVLLENGV